MYKGKHGNKHPGAQHVVAGLAVFAIEQLNRSRHLCLVMEPMREPLVTFRRRLCEANSTSLHATNVKLMKSILRQVLAGLDYLHSECRIVHTGESFSPVPLAGLRADLTKTSRPTTSS